MRDHHGAHRADQGLEGYRRDVGDGRGGAGGGPQFFTGVCACGYFYTPPRASDTAALAFLEAS